MNDDVIFNYYLVNTINLTLENPKNNDTELELFFTQIFALASNSIQKRFSEYLLRVLPSKDTIYKSVQEIDESVVKSLTEFMEVFNDSKEVSPLMFGRVKYYFDSFFFSLTTKGNLDYLYDDDYLLTVDEAGEKLKVSRPTINKYGKNGQLEVLDTSKHKKIPLHAIEIWNDTVLNVKTQILREHFFTRNDSLHQQYEEILAKIKEFEKMYDNNPFNVEYKDVLSGEKHWDEVDSVSDYFEWESLIEDLIELKKQLGITHE